MTGKTDEQASVRGRWWALSLLSALYVLSFVDRVILALLVSPLKADLQVTDVQLGLLFGPAFAVFYALVGLPVALLADRGNRRLIILGGVALWGLATVGSAFAPNYATLVVLRIGLAIGEAALTPSVYSMIADLFAPRDRRTAASVYSAFGMAGASAAYIIGAMVVAAVLTPGSDPQGWRLVFFIVGAPTIVVGLLFAATVREPARQARALAKVAAPLADTLSQTRWPVYLTLFCAAGLCAAPGYAAAAWAPEFIHRRYGWVIQNAGLLFGLVGLFSASLGTLLAPRVTQWLERRGQEDGALLVTSTFVALGACAMALAPLAPSGPIFALSAGLGSLLLTGGANNVLVSMQVVAPPARLAIITASFLTATSLIGLGLGPLLVSLVSVWIPDARQGLGSGLTVVALVTAIPAAIVFLFVRRAYVRLKLA